MTNENARDQLFNHLHRGGKWAYWWTHPEKVSTWWKCGDPAPLPRARNIYFGVHPTDQSGQIGERSKTSTVTVINCLFAEFDKKDGASIELMEALDPAPSVVIDSGGGWHCYWLLDDPVVINDNNRESMRSLQSRWVDYFGGDPGSKDLARVLRVPGTTNGKYIPPRPVEFVKAEFDRLYNIDSLELLIPAPAVVPQVENNVPMGDSSAEFWLEKYLATARIGNRNDTGKKLAIQLRDSCRLNEAQAKAVPYPEMVPQSDASIYTRDEWETTVHSIYTGAPREPAKAKKSMVSTSVVSIPSKAPSLDSNTNDIQADLGMDLEPPPNFDDTAVRMPSEDEIEQQLSEAIQGKDFTNWSDLDQVIGPICWDWPYWLAKGFLNISVGMTGEGKSIIALRICGCYLLGWPWPDGTPYTGELGNVLWCEAEAAQAMNLARAKKWGLPLERILSPLGDPLGDFRLNNPEHKGKLAYMALQPDVKFIVVDSLSGADPTAEKSTEDASNVNWLAALSRDCQKPIQLTHHLRKKGMLDIGDSITLDRVRGISTIIQYARVIWALDAPDQSSEESKQHKRLSVIKSNLDKMPKPVGVIIGSDGITFGEAPATPKPETTQDRAKELLLTLLSDAPVRSTVIEEECQQAGISWRTAQGAKKLLKITSVKMDDGWYWSLPVKGQYEK